MAQESCRRPGFLRQLLGWIVCWCRWSLSRSYREHLKRAYVKRTASSNTYRKLASRARWVPRVLCIEPLSQYLVRTWANHVLRLDHWFRHTLDLRLEHSFASNHLEGDRWYTSWLWRGPTFFGQVHALNVRSHETICCYSRSRWQYHWCLVQRKHPELVLHCRHWTRRDRADARWCLNPCHKTEPWVVYQDGVASYPAKGISANGALPVRGIPCYSQDSLPVPQLA